MNKLNFILIIIIAVSIGAAIFFNKKYRESRKDYKDQVELYNAITSELKNWQDKDSLNLSKIQIMQTEKASDFLKIKNLQGTNLELQNLIKNQNKKIKDLNTALILKDETVIRDTTRIYYPIGGDTLVFSQSVLIDTIKNKWIDVT